MKSAIAFLGRTSTLRHTCIHVFEENGLLLSVYRVHCNLYSANHKINAGQSFFKAKLFVAQGLRD